MPWVIVDDCCATAMAVELSERMLAARARFTGAAMLALTIDIAARSGSSSPASSSSSSRLNGLYSSCSLLIWLLLFVGSPVGVRLISGLCGAGRLGFVTARVLNDPRVADRPDPGGCAVVALGDGERRVNGRGHVHAVSLDVYAFLPAHDP